MVVTFCYIQCFYVLRIIGCKFWKHSELIFYACYSLFDLIIYFSILFFFTNSFTPQIVWSPRSDMRKKNKILRDLDFKTRALDFDACMRWRSTWTGCTWKCSRVWKSRSGNAFFFFSLSLVFSKHSDQFGQLSAYREFVFFFFFWNSIQTFMTLNSVIHDGTFWHYLF